MIDPFSCLNIATAIAQFLDFGVGVLKTAHEIHKSKATSKDLSNFEQDVSQFKTLSTSISEARGDNYATITKDGHALTDVAQQCETLSNEILAALGQGNVQGRSSKMHSFKVALKVRLKSSDFDKYEKRLSAIKLDLCTHLVKAVDSKQSSILGLLERLQRQDRVMETHLSSKLDEIKIELERLPTQVQSTNSLTVANIIQQLNAEFQRVSRVQYVLSTFRFDAIHAREDNIKERHSQTFKWALSSEFYFLEWLNNDSPLFWISGKAGSGKSTLMKYLSESSETRRQLEKWAGDGELVLSRHFFWNPGTPMQKSYKGLLQSLCYDILRSLPSLVPLVCKAAWTTMAGPQEWLQPFSQDTYKWRETEMVDLIRKIGEVGMQTSGRKIHLCFFIDGLDEYHGEQDQLIEAISTLSTIHNVKICMASRPWNIFRQSFNGLHDTRCAMILQDLTRKDITEYVQDRLERHPGYLELQQIEPRCSELVSEIAIKAEGVFLWVYLVVNELSKSFTNRDDYLTLQRRLQRLPPDLEAYFRFMFDNLEEFYRRESAQIFRAAISSTSGLPLLGLAAIFCTEPLAAPLLGDMNEELKGDDMTDLMSILATRTRGCCGDLMEVATQSASFLHRSVRDFLASDQMVAELDSRAGTNFNIDRTMCRVSLIGIVYYPDRLAMKSLSRARTYLSSSAFEYDASSVQANDDQFANWPLLSAFFTHARNLEDNKQYSTIDLYEVLEYVTSTFFGFSINDLRNIQAFMQLKSQLHRSISADENLDVESLTSCAVNSLYYVFYTDDPPSDFESLRATRYTRLLAEHACGKDPDRRDFNLEILRSLLAHGADSDQPWNFVLQAMLSNKLNSEFRRATFFSVSSELIRAGARETIVVFRGDRLEENEALERIFGKLDAQRLSSLRGPSSEEMPTQRTASNEHMKDMAKRQRTALASILSWFTPR